MSLLSAHWKKCRHTRKQTNLTNIAEREISTTTHTKKQVHLPLVPTLSILQWLSCGNHPIHSVINSKKKTQKPSTATTTIKSSQNCRLSNKKQSIYCRCGLVKEAPTVHGDYFSLACTLSCWWPNPFWKRQKGFLYCTYLPVLLQQPKERQENEYVGIKGMNVQACVEGGYQYWHQNRSSSKFGRFRSTILKHSYAG
jgi:hypothetical protein